MKNWLIPGLIVLGALIVIASLVAPTRSFDLFQKKSLATIIEVTGSATAQGLDEIDSLTLKKDSQIKTLDLLKTEAQSEITVLINSIQGEFRLLENSEALIEETESGKILVTVRQGDLLVDQFGKKPSFMVRKEGRQLSAMDYALSNDRNAELLRKQGTALNGTDSDKGLSQSKIEEIIGSKRSDFFRCYGQLIQKSEQAHGQVILSFEISNLGKVVKVDITKTEIEDASFKSCLSEVVARTSFPRFSGANITTVFPLKFE